MSDLIISIFVIIFMLSPFIILAIVIYWIIKKIRRKKDSIPQEKITLENNHNEKTLNNQQEELEYLKFTDSETLFANIAFLKLQNQKYEFGTGAFNDAVMTMIAKFINYMKTLEQSWLDEFKKDEISINRLNKSVGDDEIKYGEKLLKIYKEHYNK